MLQGNRSRQDLSRFRVLALLSTSDFGFTTAELAKASGRDRSSSRSFQASLGTRLRRLRRWGLVRCRLDKFDRPMRSRRKGVTRWRLSTRGVERLAWAKSNGLL